MNCMRKWRRSMRRSAPRPGPAWKSHWPSRKNQRSGHWMQANCRWAGRRNDAAMPCRTRSPMRPTIRVRNWAGTRSRVEDRSHDPPNPTAPITKGRKAGEQGSEPCSPRTSSWVACPRGVMFCREWQHILYQRRSRILGRTGNPCGIRHSGASSQRCGLRPWGVRSAISYPVIPRIVPSMPQVMRAQVEKENPCTSLHRGSRPKERGSTDRGRSALHCPGPAWCGSGTADTAPA